MGGWLGKCERRGALPKLASPFGPMSAVRFDMRGELGFILVPGVPSSPPTVYNKGGVG